MRFLLLGGYGQLGQVLVPALLAEFSDLELIIAGRNGARAQAEARRWQQTFPAHQLAGLQLDLADDGALGQAIGAADVTINLTSNARHLDRVLYYLHQHRKGGMDSLLATQEKEAVLEKWVLPFREAGLCYLTDGGFHPGLPGVLVRWAAAEIGLLIAAEVFSAIRIPWQQYTFSRETWVDFLAEFRNYRNDWFRQGEWRRPSWSTTQAFSFGEPFGHLTCTPLFLPELAEVTTVMPTLQQTGFWVSGFNPVADYVVVPLLLLGLRIFPRSFDPLLARFLQWGLNQSRPPFGVRLVLTYQTAVGKSGRLQLSHADGYIMTALPMVAALRQYVDGKIPQRGIQRQAVAVDPGNLVADLRRLGVEVKYEED